MTVPIIVAAVIAAGWAYIWVLTRWERNRPHYIAPATRRSPEPNSVNVDLPMAQRHVTWLRLEGGPE